MITNNKNLVESFNNFSQIFGFMGVIELYQRLFEYYGCQGWWPLFDCMYEFGENGYHKGDYNFPENDKQRFEICVGAILTQNTSWKNVEKALVNLRKKRFLSPVRIAKAKSEQLQDCIRPSGYFNQKAKKLKHFAEFYLNLGSRVPARGELLEIWGVGPETADSMLCYAYKQPYFVVDTYTKRLFDRENLLRYLGKYEDFQELVHAAAVFEFPEEFDRVKFYQEFHALIVQNAKDLNT